MSRACAPGKLVLTGAYAVLEGAPALVLAVDRLAIADTSRAGEPTREVRAALGERRAPAWDARALEDGGRKLGLGSSAAVLVATLAALALDEGRDVRDPAVRASLYAAARDAHARAQGGGSGVDVAASTFGGALVHRIDRAPRAARLPAGLVWQAYFSGTSARTSELRARVDAIEPGARAALMTRLAAVAERAERALAEDAAALVAAARETCDALDALGAAAGAPIVTDAVRSLADRARGEGAAFLPSGAGGGDVAVWMGTARPSEAFKGAASALGMRALDLGLDEIGVRALSSASADDAPSLSNTP